MSESEHNVDDDAKNHRFANRKGGLDPQLIYWLEENRLILMHTDVPEELAAPRHRRAAPASNRRRGGEDRRDRGAVVPVPPQVVHGAFRHRQPGPIDWHHDPGALAPSSRGASG